MAPTATFGVFRKKTREIHEGYRLPTACDSSSAAALSQWDSHQHHGRRVPDSITSDQIPDSQGDTWRYTCANCSGPSRLCASMHYMDRQTQHKRPIGDVLATTGLKVPRAYGQDEDQDVGPLCCSNERDGTRVNTCRPLYSSVSR